jgi:DGQHR domain-containing protein
MSATREIRLPALEVRQNPGRVFYAFAVDGKLVPRFAAVSRISRQANGDLKGYQRPEVLAHIREIRNYIESASPLLPNAVVIAFDGRVRFEASKGALDSGYSRMGTLIIPITQDEAEAEKPGFVVDGQQRLAAIRDAEVAAFPIAATAFVTDDLSQQTEQFILINSTKPLPKGLIYELLPTTESRLPVHLEKRRYPAHLLARLNRDDASPFKGMIQTPTTPEGVVKDNSILRMIENSLTDGALYRFAGEREDETNEAAIVTMLSRYWAAVREVFPAAWRLPPRRSRLMHGVGIVSLGFVMDAIADRLRKKSVPTAADFAGDLEGIREVCRWTEGFWDFGPGQQKKWNELQNTPRDVQLLANYLLHEYKTRVWSKA